MRKHTRRALYDSASATIGALDLGSLFGADMFESVCDDQAMLAVMTDVQRDITKRVLAMGRGAKESTDGR